MQRLRREIQKVWGHFNWCWPTREDCKMWQHQEWPKSPCHHALLPSRRTRSLKLGWGDAGRFGFGPDLSLSELDRVKLGRRVSSCEMEADATDIGEAPFAPAKLVREP